MMQSGDRDANEPASGSRRQLIPSLEQPFSLMTIRSNHLNSSRSRKNDAGQAKQQQDDLLTIRCLESSEKKMRLLKDLLSPDEFELTVGQKTSTLIEHEAELRSSDGVEEIQEDNLLSDLSRDRRKLSAPGSSSIPAYLDAASLHPRLTRRGSMIRDQRQKLGQSHRLSKSTANLRCTKQHQSQAQKREAMNFFHHDDVENINCRHRRDVPIVLRKPIDLEKVSAQNDTVASSMMIDYHQQKSFYCWFMSLIHYFIMLIGFHKSPPEVVVESSKQRDSNREETKFVEYHQTSIGDHWPLASVFNLQLIWQRLVNSGHQHKIKLPPLVMIEDEWILVRVRKGNQSFGDKRRDRVKRLSETRCKLKLNPQNLMIESDLHDLLFYQIYSWLLSKIYTCQASALGHRGRTLGRNTDTDQQRIDVPEAAANQRGAIASSRFEFRQIQMINQLYAKLFRSDPSDPSVELKSAKIINRIDPVCVLELLGNSTIQAYNPNKRPQFKLDPLLDDTFFNQVSGLELRHNLLRWRQLNNINQPVHLSEAENLKRYGFRLKQISSASSSNRREPSLAQFMLEAPINDYRLIEQKRLRASRLIREYELELRNILDFNARKFSAPSGHVHELLVEPQLGKPDLSKLAQIVSVMMPRYQARRPLMAGNNRKTTFFSNRKRAMMTERLISKSSRDLNPTISATTTAIDPLDGVQLVITIQKASNVPMRIQNQQLISERPNDPTFMASNRSISPNLALGRPNTSFGASLFAPRSPTTGDVSPIGNLSGISGGGGGGGPQMMKLIPSTTYVEVTFQRAQQATSLTSGRDPVWNETLFFPVQTHNTSSSKLSYLDNDGNDLTGIRGNNNQHLLSSHFVEEFVQLSLYDYDCYYLDNSEDDDNYLQSIYDRNNPTLNMVSMMPTNDLGGGQLSLANERQMTNSSSLMHTNKLSTCHQRIERHLLGSLRIPLTTLLTNDCIEGTYTLNQPIFLDNYQFSDPTISVSNTGRLNIDSIQPPTMTSASLSMETRLSLFISLDPPVTMANELHHHHHLPLGSHESQPIYEYTRLWEQVLSKQKLLAGSFQRTTNTVDSPQLSYPNNVSNLMWRKSISKASNQNRSIRALVLYKGCKYILMNRLLGPLVPPKCLLYNNRDTKTMFSLARFVSLLNPVKEGLFGLRSLDSTVCFDSQQLLEQNLGGQEEKAILLCNYFLNQGKCCALLQGDAVPDGHCIYVIVYNDQLASQRFELISTSPNEDKIIGLNPNSLLQQVSGGISDDHMISPDTLSPVDHTNFISRMPVLVNAKYIQIWDPKCAKSFSLNEQLPLINIDSIVTPENIYANIQSTDIPNGTNFDIRLRSMWFPLFDRSSDPSSTGQSSNLILDYQLRGYFRGQSRWRRQLSRLEGLSRSIGRPNFVSVVSPLYPDYDTFSHDQASHLGSYLEKVIKTNLLKWRHNRPTYFNRTLSRKLTTKLVQMEDSLISSSITHPNGLPSLATIDWRNELADLIRDATLVPNLKPGGGIGTRKVVSWPINISFTSIKPILDSLYASDVHNADLVLDSCPSHNHNSTSYNTQYLVASYVHIYPAHIMSVWLYVAALVPITAGQQRSLIY